MIDFKSNELFQSPFCYLSGHKLVQFDSRKASILKNMWRMVVLFL